MHLKSLKTFYKKKRKLNSEGSSIDYSQTSIGINNNDRVETTRMSDIQKPPPTSQMIKKALKDKRSTISAPPLNDGLETGETKRDRERYKRMETAKRQFQISVEDDMNMQT